MLTKEQIKWIKSLKINYTINKKGLVDVDGDVNLPVKNLNIIPVQFGYVGGSFCCNYNQLTSLQGSPREVSGNFYCHNNKLTSLQGAPIEVGGFFIVSFNHLTSLDGAPREVGGDFYCSDNKFTEYPDHSLIKIGGEFSYTQ